MRRIRNATLLLAALTLVAAACGDDDGSITSIGGYDLVKADTLTVCTDSPYPPMEFEVDGEFTGFDIELMREIAGDLGLTTEVVNSGFDPITSGLAMDAGDCDIAAASITITAEREENIDFSEGYFSGDQSLLARVSDGFTTLSDLSGKTLGVQTGTTGEEYANDNNPGATIVSFENPGDVILALSAGEIDGALQDIVVNGAAAFDDDALQLVEVYATNEFYGLAVKEEGAEDLLTEVNTALAAIRADGRYDTIYEEFFPTSLSLTDGAATTTTTAAETTTAAPTTTTAATTTTASGGEACAVENLNLVTAGVLTPATGEPAFPPWVSGIDGANFDTPESKTGFEAALVYEVANRLGFTDDQVTWVRTGFDEVIAPGAKNFDFNIQQFSITAQRDEVVDFSVPYYVTQQSLVVFADSEFANVTTLADLKTARLGAQIGTTSLDFIDQVIQPDAEAFVYDTNSDAKAALDAGQIDGIVVDLPTAYFITAVEIEGAVIAAAFATPAQDPDELGMLFEDGNPLRDCIDPVLEAMRADGTLQALQDEWLTQGGNIPIITE